MSRLPTDEGGGDARRGGHSDSQGLVGVFVTELTDNLRE